MADSLGWSVENNCSETRGGTCMLAEHENTAKERVELMLYNIRSLY